MIPHHFVTIEQDGVYLTFYKKYNITKSGGG